MAFEGYEIAGVGGFRRFFYMDYSPLIGYNTGKTATDCEG